MVPRAYCATLMITVAIITLWLGMSVGYRYSPGKMTLDELEQTITKTDSLAKQTLLLAVGINETCELLTKRR
jgi:hypothetical protein